MEVGCVQSQPWSRRGQWAWPGAALHKRRLSSHRDRDSGPLWLPSPGSGSALTMLGEREDAQAVVQLTGGAEARRLLAGVPFMSSRPEDAEPWAALLL